MAYAQKYGIPVTATVKKPYSMDRNLLHTYEGGILEDPWRAPDESISSRPSRRRRHPTPPRS